MIRQAQVAYAHGAASARARGGASVQISGGAIGTLGCLVRWRGVSCILGSGHVLAGAGLAAPGAPVFTPRAGSAAARQVGRTYDNAYVERSPDVLNRLDAALAEAEPDAVSREVGGYGAPREFSDTIVAGQTIRLHGAACGPRAARVRGGWTGVVRYADGSEAGFAGLVECTPYGLPGDSGAVILDDAGRVVGVHMAGASDFSVFCPISEVLRRWPGLELQNDL